MKIEDNEVEKEIIFRNAEVIQQQNLTVPICSYDFQR
jgi:hypothetical protein